MLHVWLDRLPLRTFAVAALRLAAVLSLAVATTFAPAVAQDQGPPAEGPAADIVAQAQDMTTGLVALNGQFNRARGGARDAILGELMDLAAARMDLLAGLIQSDPGAALTLALPGHLSAGMSDEVQEFLESEVGLDGTLQVLFIDFEDPSQSHAVYVLETMISDERFSLHFADNPPGLVSGTEVGVSGVLFPGAGPSEAGDTDGGGAFIPRQDLFMRFQNLPSQTVIPDFRKIFRGHLCCVGEACPVSVG